MKQDLKNIEDVKLLVNTFYGKIRDNKMLGPIFEERIKEWEPHLEKMYSFWDSILFGAGTYHGRPFDPHITMPIGKEHFTEWVGLFKQTVDELFKGEYADEAKMRAEKIGEIFAFKKEYLKGSGDSK